MVTVISTWLFPILHFSHRLSNTIYHELHQNPGCLTKGLLPVSLIVSCNRYFITSFFTTKWAFSLSLEPASSSTPVSLSSCVVGKLCWLRVPSTPALHIFLGRALALVSPGHQKHLLVTLPSFFLSKYLYHISCPASIFALELYPPFALSCHFFLSFFFVFLAVVLSALTSFIFCFYFWKSLVSSQLHVVLA